MQSVKSKQKQNKILSNEMQNVLQVSDADPRSVGVKEKKIGHLSQLSGMWCTSVI
jgi:hypothetical protein